VIVKHHNYRRSQSRYSNIQIHDLLLQLWCLTVMYLYAIKNRAIYSCILLLVSIVFIRSGKNTGAFRMSFLIFYSPQSSGKLSAEDDIAFLLNRGELVDRHILVHVIIWHTVSVINTVKIWFFHISLLYCTRKNILIFALVQYEFCFISGKQRKHFQEHWHSINKDD
jgi:hypothetical protein